MQNTPDESEHEEQSSARANAVVSGTRRAFSRALFGDVPEIVSILEIVVSLPLSLVFYHLLLGRALPHMSRDVRDILYLAMWILSYLLTVVVNRLARALLHRKREKD